MSLYDRVASLPLTVEDYVLEPLALDVGAWTRHTTIVRLRGGGHEGVGEDITYVTEDQERFQAAGPSLPLAGEATVDGFSHTLDGLELFPAPPANRGPQLYRRWAFESAALDLALRQAGASLADALGRTPRPVRFVVSRGLGDPPRFEPVRALLERLPETRFKLDLHEGWDEELMSSLAGTGAVDCVDFKGHYHGTFSGLTPDADLYRRAAEAFPDAWLEDPRLEGAPGEALVPHHARVTWDAPIHSLADVLQRPFVPTAVNMKPSRFGLLSELFRTYAWCEARGVAMYGGGQFELGPGRGQAQYLASLFHPEGANDLAPSVYNSAVLPDDLPTSPLPPTPSEIGFRLEGD